MAGQKQSMANWHATTNGQFMMHSLQS